MRSICKLGDKKSEVDKKTKFEIKDRLEPSINDVIGAINWLDLDLHRLFLSKSYNLEFINKL